MTSDWLAASSFEQTQGLIAAITTLSIHAKLTLAGQPDPVEPSDVEYAREQLLEFLQRFQRVLQSIEMSRGRTVMGADPRFGALATHYLIHKERGLERSPLYTLSVPALEQLVQSQNRDDLPRLVECLQELRLLVEHHVHADMTGLLGEA